jgi:pyruvate/2-oxoacid:ferredoxin oxidoreductase beta subunit
MSEKALKTETYMDEMSLYIDRGSIPPTSKCAACTGVLIARHALEVLGKNTVTLRVASCGAGWGGRALQCGPLGYCCFPSGGAAASGVVRGFQIQGKKVNVVLFAGDGGSYDIGLQALSAAAERGENIIWICSNNEAYMLTGVQRSGATPMWASTSTTPVGKRFDGKQREKKEIISTMEGSGAAYIATASMSHIHDFKRKVEKARQISTEEQRGLSYIEVLHTCPTGWRYPTDKMIEVSRLGVQTAWWPLYEIQDGVLKISYKPKELKPVSEFMKMQGRFRHIKDEQIEFMQNKVVKNWNQLLEREAR